MPTNKETIFQSNYFAGALHERQNYFQIKEVLDYHYGCFPVEESDMMIDRIIELIVMSDGLKNYTPEERSVTLMFCNQTKDLLRVLSNTEIKLFEWK